MAVLVLCPATEKEVRSQLPRDSENQRPELLANWNNKHKNKWDFLP